MKPLVRRKFVPPATTTGGAKKRQRFVVPSRTATTTSSSAAGNSAIKSYWTVSYSKRSNKKRKDYFDGIVVLTDGKNVVLQTLEGKQVARHKTSFTASDMKVDFEFDIGWNELTVSRRISNDDYESGRIFLNAAASNAASTSAVMLSGSMLQGSSGSASFKRPGGVSFAKENKPLPKCPYPVDGPGVIVLSPPSVCVPTGVPVVLDPRLVKRLRPHQIEGVRFLYDSVTGATTNGKHCGCILADEMGLGKTLQSIALVWTLLKQGPLGTPTARQAVIVTPSSLVMNWAAEFHKWLGPMRCTPIAVNKSGKAAKAQVEDFVVGRGNVAPVLIISYEMCVKYVKLINQVRSVGLMICDEGHRLKNSGGNKTIRALKSFRTNRIVLLTGKLKSVCGVFDFVDAL